MAYQDSSTAGDRATAIIAVAAVHAALGVAIVTGLAGGIMNERVRDEITSIFIPKPEPVPTSTPEPASEPRSEARTKVVVPQPALELDPVADPVGSTAADPGYTGAGAGTTGTAGTGNGQAGLAKDPPRGFDPVAPKPRNGGWVTDQDYRSIWINRGWEGTVGFLLVIGADGRVESCTITQSAGHAALDRATCSLVQRRARFDPARNERGEAAAGRFSSAVRWQIPR